MNKWKYGEIKSNHIFHCLYVALKSKDLSNKLKSLSTILFRRYLGLFLKVLHSRYYFCYFI